MDTWAARDDAGVVDVLLWNVAPDARTYEGRDDLGRAVDVRVAGLSAEAYDVEVARVDNEHSSISAHVPAGTVWPDQDEWTRLHGLDGLHTEAHGTATPDGGAWSTRITVPMPGIARVRLTPR